MKIEFNASQVWYSISFNGRNILEMYGSSEDIKQFCQYLMLSAKTERSEKMKRICVIRDFATGDEILQKHEGISLYDEKIFDRFNVFVIENTKEFVTDSVWQIIKNHPECYWLECKHDAPECISSDNICMLKADEDRSHFWNVFVPYENTLYSDLKFSFSDKDYRINMGNHNAILIRGNTCTGKTMMCDQLNALTTHVHTWIEWNGKLEGFLVGNDELRFAKVCVLSRNDLFYINNMLKIESVLEKYRVFVFDNADILVNSEVGKVIEAHPEHKWVLIGNYKPDFIHEDAVCVWKNEGHRYWNEFVSESN